MARVVRPDRLLDWFAPLLICFPGAALPALGWTAALPFADGRSWFETVGLLLIWPVGVCATAMPAWLIARVYLDRGARA